MILKKNLLVLGIDTIDPSKFRKIENYRFRNKPKGGLWTSPENSEFGWKDFVISESYRTDKYLSKCTLITLKESAKIFILDSAEDFKKVPKYFCKPKEFEELFLTEELINFEELSKHYDGLWLTMNGLKELSGFDIFDFETNHLSSIGNLYGWDVETVLLFNLDCIESHA